MLCIFVLVERRTCVMLIDLSKHNIYNPNFKALNPAVRQAIDVGVISRRNFVPTPPTIADIMIRKAEIQPQDRILEPSAGQGSIIERIHKIFHYFNIVDAVEKHPVLCEILKSMQKTRLVGTDLMTYNPGQIYDKVLMNPPFNSGNPIKHTMHCFGLLKSGGTLVTIVPDYVLKTQNHFMDLAFSRFVDAEVIGLGKDAFLASDLPANIATSIVVLKKHPNCNVGVTNLAHSLQLNDYCLPFRP